jgi:hypothetical protein
MAAPYTIYQVRSMCRLTVDAADLVGLSSSNVLRADLHASLEDIGQVGRVHQETGHRFIGRAGRVGSVDSECKLLCEMCRTVHEERVL